jgi:predicted transcriptional regulator
MSLSDVFNETSENIIYTFVQNAQDASVIVSAHLLEELLQLRQLRDRVLELPHGQFSLNMDDINDIISFVCTT